MGWSLTVPARFAPLRMRFLFRPIRTIVLIGAAFLGGVVYEKSSHADRCLNAGGSVKTGLCEGARP